MISDGVINKENSQEIEEPKLKLGEKIALVCGNTPATFHYQMIQVYLLFFYTDFMNVNPGILAGLFLIVRIISALTAPFLGVYMDKINFKSGKYAPWFILLGVPLGISGWLTFTDFNLSTSGTLIYVILTYTLYSILTAVITIPTNAVLPTVTKRVDERVSVGQFSYFFIIIGAILVQVGAVPLYKILGGGNDAKGFSALMAIVGVLTIMLAFFQKKKIKEKYINKSKVGENKPSLKQMLSATFTNRTAVIVYLYIFSNAISGGVRSSVTIYYFKYFFNNEGYMASSAFVLMFPAVIGTIISKPVIERLGLKGAVLTTVIATIISSVFILFIPSGTIGFILFLIINSFSTIMGSIATPAQAAMLPAAIDYTEWKSKLNLNGFMSSLNGFTQTLGTALSGAIVAIGLVFIGYVPGVEQSSDAIFGFKFLVSVLPALLLLIQLCIIWFDLTEEKQALITEELASRRKIIENEIEVYE